MIISMWKINSLMIIFEGKTKKKTIFSYEIQDLNYIY